MANINGPTYNKIIQESLIYRKIPSQLVIENEETIKEFVNDKTSFESIKKWWRDTGKKEITLYEKEELVLDELKKLGFIDFYSISHINKNFPNFNFSANFCMTICIMILTIITYILSKKIGIFLAFIVITIIIILLITNSDRIFLNKKGKHERYKLRLFNKINK